MKALFRWTGWTLNLVLAVFMAVWAVNYKTCTYLCSQGWGQMKILFGTIPIADYQSTHELSQRETENLLMIETLKKYSVDSLGFKPTDNYQRIYNQGDRPLLWVVTASEPFHLEEYHWKFPLVGEVSYKGFFDLGKAKKEYNHLVAQGYDADIASVSAWSTLGWLSDPVLSGTLKRSKGAFVNLIFHELFHATWYQPGSVNLNENLASFIADKATREFLKFDTLSLTTYVKRQVDEELFTNYVLRQVETLKGFYEQTKNDPKRKVLKLKTLMNIADSINLLPLNDSARFLSRKADMLSSKNAWFVGYMQYDSMQDSLEKVFNKIYRGDLKKMVRDLTLR